MDFFVTAGGLMERSRIASDNMMKTTKEELHVFFKTEKEHMEKTADSGTNSYLTLHTFTDPVLAQEMAAERGYKFTFEKDDSLIVEWGVDAMMDTCFSADKLRARSQKARARKSRRKDDEVAMV